MDIDPTSVADFDTAFATLLYTSEHSRFGFAFGHCRLGPMEVYLRIGKRMVGDSYEEAVTLVSFVVPPVFQRQGLCNTIVARIRAATRLPLFLENASIEFARHMLAKGGWQMQRANMATIDIYRRG
jgi:hypothetical protein